MDQKVDVEESLQKAKDFVSVGVKQILNGQVIESHGVSISPGATALATLALIALGRGFEVAQQRGSQWLRQHQTAQGWGKFPGDEPDEEITKLVQTVLQSSKGGWIARIRLLTQARQFSQMILSLGQRIIPGLDGPTPEEIQFPRILEENVLNRLPLYGRPVVVAAALLTAEENQVGLQSGVDFLRKTQMEDGSWAEDIVATSICILALLRSSGNNDPIQRAGRWLTKKQYLSGGWPAFDQLKTWAMGWAVIIMSEGSGVGEVNWLQQALEWLKLARNADGSYGSTPPFTHPDLDDTAVALCGIHQATGGTDQETVELLKLLQNNDGSWGTFPSFNGIPPNVECKFPVYIASLDVTIHILEALWRLNSRSQAPTIWRGLNWLIQQQGKTGDYSSIWYEGSIYSTAQVLELLSKWRFSWEQWKSAHRVIMVRKRTFDFLLSAQNEDGGWGSSVVETTLAISALAHYPRRVPKEVFKKGITKVLNSQNRDGSFEANYKGIYAKGWNYEEPIATALTAIRALGRYKSLGF